MAKQIAVSEQAEEAKEKSLVTNTVRTLSPELEELYAEDANTNSFAQGEVAFPFLKVLQKGSPEVDQRSDSYVEGARESMILNSVTHKTWEGCLEDKGKHIETLGPIFIPVHFTLSFTEWKPDRKGLVKDWLADSSIMSKAVKGGIKGRQDIIPGTGNVVQKAGLYYGYVFDPEEAFPTIALVSMASSNFTVSRRWNTHIASIMLQDSHGKPFNPAMYYMSYRLGSKYATNDDGTWYKYDVVPYKPTVELSEFGTQIYKAAREFNSKILAGSVQDKVKHQLDINEGAENAPF